MRNPFTRDHWERKSITNTSHIPRNVGSPELETHRESYPPPDRIPRTLHFAMLAIGPRGQTANPTTGDSQTFIPHIPFIRHPGLVLSAGSFGVAEEVSVPPIYVGGSQ